MKRVLLSLLSVITVITSAAVFVTPALADMSFRNHTVSINSCRKLGDRDNDRDDMMIFCNQSTNHIFIAIPNNRFFFSGQSLMGNNVSFHSNMIRLSI